MAAVADSAITEQVYTSRIIKASALLADTRILLAGWDETVSVTENLARFRQTNIFGKTSRSRIEDILRIFRQRYLESEQVREALIYLAKSQFPIEAFTKLFYFHSAQADALLHDTVTELLVPMWEAGRVDVATVDVQRAITRWAAEGKTTGQWSESTVVRVVRNLMASLRDFGILEGTAKKRLASVYLPLEAFAYIAFYLYQLQPSGEKLLHNREWQLFFLNVPKVERLFIEAQQNRLLEYNAAGSIIRIDFPASTLEEYARVISQRAV